MSAHRLTKPRSIHSSAPQAPFGCEAPGGAPAPGEAPASQNSNISQQQPAPACIIIIFHQLWK